ncbi:hypothetical protein DFO45_2298 [Azorhizobium sp. AG788]|uniref:phage tail tube protein n=1 Tax=Azorhizobium sp. AG788 TaxID=2183897 RepID=UPI001061DD9E|nr:phage tail tube protein [Azorhizobium sp. AG788]TDT94548.1 hypothetical protein DFO45_2298 [Azorhizobium sp. AG788]
MSSPASGSEVRYAFVPETAYGETPATPAFQVMRVTGGGLKSNKSTTTSKEINSTGEVKAETLVGIDVAGSYPFELSYGSFDAFFAAALHGTWTNNVLKNGTVQHSFTVEETVNLADGSSYSRFLGVEVNSVSLSLNSREDITGSLDLMGKLETLDDAEIAGATYVAANDEPVLAASMDMGTLTVTGITDPIDIKSITLSVGRNLRTRPVIGSLYSLRKGRGQLDVTGTIECYFESRELYQKVLDHGIAEVSFTVGAASGKKYTFRIPKAQFLDGSRTTGGNTEDVMVSIPIRGLKDSTSGCSIQITRAVA